MFRSMHNRLPSCRTGNEAGDLATPKAYAMATIVLNVPSVRILSKQQDEEKPPEG